MRRTQGEGCYYKEGKYFRWKGVHKGVEKKFSSTVQKALREKVAIYLQGVKAAGGFAPSAGNTKLGDYLDYWLESVVLPSRASTTYSGYVQMVRMYIRPALGEWRLTDLTSIAIRRMVTDLLKRVGPRTAGYALAVLKTSLTQCTKESPPLLANNPARAVDAPKCPAPRKRTLTSDGIDKLRTLETQNRFHPMILLMLSSGATISEALGWLWEDYDESAELIRIMRKGERPRGGVFDFADVKRRSRRRTIPLGSMALLALESIRSRQATDRARMGDAYPELGLIFTTSTGLPPDSRNIQKALDEMLATIGVPHIGLHDLRKSFGSELARSGVPLHVIKTIMGHSDLKTTESFYLDVVGDDLALARAPFNRVEKQVDGPGQSVA